MTTEEAGARAKRLIEHWVEVPGPSIVLGSQVQDRITAALLQVERETAEMCATLAEELETEWWRAYKEPGGPDQADPHVEGKSDGASQVARSIRLKFGLRDE